MQFCTQLSSMTLQDEFKLTSLKFKLSWNCCLLDRHSFPAKKLTNLSPQRWSNWVRRHSPSQLSFAFKKFLKASLISIPCGLLLCKRISFFVLVTHSCSKQMQSRCDLQFRKQDWLEIYDLWWCTRSIYLFYVIPWSNLGVLTLVASHTQKCAPFGSNMFISFYLLYSILT